MTGQVDALLIGMAAGGTILLIQRMKNEARANQRTIVTAIEALASVENRRATFQPIHADKKERSGSGYTRASACRTGETESLADSGL